MVKGLGGRELVAGEHLELEACPWCGVAAPYLAKAHSAQFQSPGRARIWSLYACRGCAGAVLAEHVIGGNVALRVLPGSRTVADELPDRAREFLRQAVASKAQPTAAVMVAASAVDAMLKAKGLRDGSLYARIDKAAADHIITPEMARWAHQVRLDANEQRHDDEDVPIATPGQAEQAIDFAEALGEYLFVLPSRVTKGVGAAGGAAPKTT